MTCRNLFIKHARAHNENSRVTIDCLRRKTPQKLRGTERHSVNIMTSTGQRFCYLKPVSVIVHNASCTASGRTWSEARAPAPLPSDKPGATPPVDAYAPLGAVVPVHRKHHRPPLGTRPPPARRTPVLCTTPTHNFTIILYLDILQKTDNFPLLKKSRKRRPVLAKLASAQIPTRTMKRKQNLFSNFLIGASIGLKFNIQRDRPAT